MSLKWKGLLGMEDFEEIFVRWKENKIRGARETEGGDRRWTYSFEESSLQGNKISDECPACENCDGRHYYKRIIGYI